MSYKPNISESNLNYRNSRSNNPNLEKFKFLHKNVLNKDASRIASPSEVVDALKQLAEYLIWEDRNNEDAIFEYFCEENIMDYMTGVLCRSSSRPIRIQLVQTISMLIHNITNKRALYYFLSNNYINGLIMVPEMYAGGDVSSWTISLLKTLSSILDKSTIKFFFLQKRETFPLLDKSLMFLNNHDSMKRAHVMTIILNIFKVKDDDVIDYIINRSKILLQLVLYLKYCWYRLNKYINKYKRFKENVLIECDDTLCFIEELMDLEIQPINEKIIYYIYNICFIPLLRNILKKNTLNLRGLESLDMPQHVDSEFINNTYDKLSNTVGLVTLYIKNKTNLYNNFSDAGSIGDNVLADQLETDRMGGESKPMEVEEELAANVGDKEDLKEGSSTTHDENNDEPTNIDIDNDSYDKSNINDVHVSETKDEVVNEESGDKEAMNDKEALEQPEDAEDEADYEDEVNESEGLINSVVYYVVVNILINCKRKELLKPLVLLFFSPFVSKHLLVNLGTDSCSPPSENNTPTSGTVTPSTARTIAANSREFDKQNLFDHVNYQIDKNNIDAYHSLVRFMRYYDRLTQSDESRESNYGFTEDESTIGQHTNQEDETMTGNESDELNKPDEDESGEYGRSASGSSSGKLDKHGRVDCVVNLIMGAFVYDAAASLRHCDNKMLMLLKLLIHKQAQLLEEQRGSYGQNAPEQPGGSTYLLVLSALLASNSVYLQLFNAICAHVTNCRLNVVTLKLYNALLSRHAARLGSPAAEELRDELRFHLDIVFNIVRIYVLHSIESTTLLYVSVFYDEWVKQVKLHHTGVHNLLQYEDVLPLAEEPEPPAGSQPESPGRDPGDRRGRLLRERRRERLVRRLFFRGGRAASSASALSASSQESYSERSPVGVFKRYIQITLLFKELYATIKNENSTSLTHKVHLKPIQDTLSYMYESCPLFYSRLEMLYLNDQQVKLGNAITLGENTNYFRCIIKNNNEQRQRIYIIHDIFFILAKFKTGSKQASQEENNLLKNLSLYSRQYINESRNSKDAAMDTEKLEKEIKESGLALEITCVHFLWNCLIKKVDKIGSKFNLLISWHPHYKSLTPSQYYSNSNHRWNDPIVPIVSEFDVVFNNVRDLNAAIKMHNNSKKNLSNMCLLSLQDYLYNSI